MPYAFQLSRSPEDVIDAIVAAGVEELHGSGLHVAVVVFKAGLEGGVQAVMVGSDKPAEAAQAFRFARLAVSPSAVQGRDSDG